MDSTWEKQTELNDVVDRVTKGKLMTSYEIIETVLHNIVQNHPTREIPIGR